MFFEEDVVGPGVVFPVDEEVGFEAVEGVGPENGVGQEELGGDGLFDGGEGDGLAGGGVGELDGADAAANAFAVVGLDVEDGLGVEFVGEDGLVGAAAGDGAVGEGFDEVFALAPFAGGVVLIVKAVFEEAELVGCGFRPAVWVVCDGDF